jgi:signal transduction histidine kinase
MAQTEKLAAIGQLAAGVAHEINNPMGVIQCYARLIVKSQEPGSQTMQDAEIIQKHTRQCKKVVEDLLNFARISESRKQVGRIDDCLTEVVAVLEPHYNKEGITLSVEKAADLPPVEVDEVQFKQVLMNLIINAVQAMPEGGRIAVTADCDPETGALLVSVADTGLGIGEKHLHRIFDPFFTTKGAGKGTGLGLSVSYGIIQQHGGDITVESVPGNGTTFTITLPAKEAVAE